MPWHNQTSLNSYRDGLENAIEEIDEKEIEDFDTEIYWKKTIRYYTRTTFGLGYYV